MFRKCTFKVKNAFLAVKKVQSYETRCVKLFVHCFSAVCVRQYCTYDINDWNRAPTVILAKLGVLLWNVFIFFVLCIPISSV